MESSYWYWLEKKNYRATPDITEMFTSFSIFLPSPCITESTQINQPYSCINYTLVSSVSPGTIISFGIIKVLILSLILYYKT